MTAPAHKRIDDELVARRLDALRAPIRELGWAGFPRHHRLIMRARLAFLRSRAHMLSRLLDHGMDTQEGALELEHFHSQRSQYAPSGWRALRKALHAVPLSHEDVFVDFGSGKGRVVYQAARRPVKRVIGVEVSPHLNEVASRNLERVRHRLACPDVVLVTADAADYRLPDDATIAYFYHPFTGETFEQVYENIRDSLLRSPRRFWVIYVCPQNEQILLRDGLFRCVRRWRGGRRFDNPLRRIGVYVSEPGRYGA